MTPSSALARGRSFGNSIPSDMLQEDFSLDTLSLSEEHEILNMIKKANNNLFELKVVIFMISPKSRLINPMGLIYFYIV